MSESSFDLDQDFWFFRFNFAGEKGKTVYYNTL